MIEDRPHPLRPGHPGGPGVAQDGAPLSIEFTIQMIWDDEGKLLRASAIIRDVTERFTRDRGMRKRLAGLEAKARAPDPEH